MKIRVNRIFPYARAAPGLLPPKSGISVMGHEKCIVFLLLKIFLCCFFRLKCSFSKFSLHIKLFLLRGQPPPSPLTHEPLIHGNKTSCLYCVDHGKPPIYCSAKSGPFLPTNGFLEKNSFTFPTAIRFSWILNSPYP